jgi:hypothetical protein
VSNTRPPVPPESAQEAPAPAPVVKLASKRERDRVAKLRENARALRLGTAPGATGPMSVAELKRAYGPDWDPEWLEGLPAPSSSRKSNGSAKPKAAKSTEPKAKKLPITNDAVRMIRAEFGKTSAEQLVVKVEAMCGATATVEQIDKIGKREIRDDVPDVARGSKPAAVKSTAKPASDKPAADKPATPKRRGGSTPRTTSKFAAAKPTTVTKPTAAKSSRSKTRGGVTVTVAK